MNAPSGTRERFEAQVASLRGKRLSGVRYFEIYYTGGQAGWDTWPAFDTLDFGLDLITDDGQILGITWGTEFIQYGLSLVDGSVQATVVDAAVWDVGTQSRWASLLGQQVTGSILYWREDDILDPHVYPEDLELRFATGTRVFLCAQQYLPESDMFFGMSDQVSVFFDEDVAQRYRVGPFAPTLPDSQEVAK